MQPRSFQSVEAEKSECCCGLTTRELLKDTVKVSRSPTWGGRIRTYQPRRPGTRTSIFAEARDYISAPKIRVL